MGYEMFVSQQTSEHIVRWNYGEDDFYDLYRCNDHREAQRVLNTLTSAYPSGPDLFNLADAKKAIKKAKKGTKESTGGDAQDELGK